MWLNGQQHHNDQLMKELIKMAQTHIPIEKGYLVNAYRLKLPHNSAELTVYFSHTNWDLYSTDTIAKCKYNKIPPPWVIKRWRRGVEVEHILDSWNFRK